MKILDALFDLLTDATASITSTPSGRSASPRRHHRAAISDGLRRGSSESGKVMARWRWGKKR